MRNVVSAALLIERLMVQLAAKLRSVKGKFNFGPYVGLELEWQPDETEVKASWEMYIELVTRISVMKLRKEEGLIKEALNSLHSLFPTAREILRRYGPGIAVSKGKGNASFGKLTVVLLNEIVRPFLAKWHPLFSHHESLRPPTTSPFEYERKWEMSPRFRAELEEMQKAVAVYADLLAQVSGVDSLI